MRPAFAPHRYSGIEIPVFDPSSIRLRGPGELRAPCDEDTFVREVSLRQPRSMEDKPLEAILERTNTEIAHLARLCKATTVNPRWGLYPTREPKVLNRAIPAGFILAAEVDYIPDAVYINDNHANHDDSTIGIFRSIEEGIATYKTLPGDKLTDIWPHQFVMQENAPNLLPIYVDIEPYWHY